MKVSFSCWTGILHALSCFSTWFPHQLPYLMSKKKHLLLCSQTNGSANEKKICQENGSETYKLLQQATIKMKKKKRLQKMYTLFHHNIPCTLLFINNLTIYLCVVLDLWHWLLFLGQLFVCSLTFMVAASVVLACRFLSANAGVGIRIWFLGQKKKNNKKLQESFRCDPDRQTTQRWVKDKKTTWEWLRMTT